MTIPKLKEFTHLSNNLVGALGPFITRIFIYLQIT